MSTHRLRGFALSGLAWLLAACVPVTVNITFPQQSIDSAAGRIEDMVRSPENPKPPAPAEPKKGPQGRLAGWVLAALAPRAAKAQVPEIKTQTPQLMKVIASRRGRVDEVDQLKARGCVGETNQGMLEARAGQGCPGDTGRLVGAENADRQLMYEELMRQNNMPASDAPRVRAAFARAKRDRARPGEWIQQDGGQWVKK